MDTGRLLRFVLAALACPALAFSAPAPVGTAQPAPASAPAAAPQPAAPSSASAVSAITEAAVRGGVLACARRIEQVSKYLTAGTQSGAYMFLPAKQPDQSLFSVSMELQGQNAAPLYASASFSPGADGGCSGVYDAVEYSPRSCADVQKSAFPSAKPAAAVKKDIGMLSAGAVRVFFMTAGSGCVIIKKEVVQ